MSKTEPCGDKVFVAEGVAVVCARPHGHPFASFNHPTRAKKYAFHEGDGWLWDDKCAWKKGEEPGPHD